MPRERQNQMDLWCGSWCIGVTQAATHSPTAERWPSKALLCRAPTGPASCDILCWVQNPTGTPLLSQHMPVITATKTRGQNIKEYRFVFLPFYLIFPLEFIFCTNHIVTIKAVLENGEKIALWYSALLYQTALGFTLFKVCSRIQLQGGFWKSSWAVHFLISHVRCSWVMVLGVFKNLGYENHVGSLSISSFPGGG